MTSPAHVLPLLPPWWHSPFTDAGDSALALACRLHENPRDAAAHVLRRGEEAARLAGNRFTANLCRDRARSLSDFKPQPDDRPLIVQVLPLPTLTLDLNHTLQAAAADTDPLSPARLTQRLDPETYGTYQRMCRHHLGVFPPPPGAARNAALWCALHAPTATDDYHRALAHAGSKAAMLLPFLDRSVNWQPERLLRALDAPASLRNTLRRIQRRLATAHHKINSAKPRHAA